MHHADPYKEEQDRLPKLEKADQQQAAIMRPLPLPGLQFHLFQPAILANPTLHSQFSVDESGMELSTPRPLQRVPTKFCWAFIPLPIRHPRYRVVASVIDFNNVPRGTIKRKKPMKNTLLATFAVALALTSLTALAQKDPDVGGAAMYPTKTIVENAVNSPIHKTLVAAVKAAGLVDTLNSTGPFTVFAPTDEAFDKLPAGTVANLVKPENKSTLVKTSPTMSFPAKSRRKASRA
jgi:hypothetical protein